MNASTGVLLRFLFLAALQVPVLAAFPKATGYVNDFAGVLDTGTRAELESLLRDTEQKTSAEVVVATVTSLEGMTVEEYANKLFREWGIGKKNKDNGVLVLVAPNARTMRIEVGYGLESILPDGLTGDLIRTDFLPSFRKNDYNAGILAGVRHVVAIVQFNRLTDEQRRLFLEESQRLSPGARIAILAGSTPFLLLGSYMAGVGLRTFFALPLLFGALLGGLSLFFVLASGPGPGIVLGPLALGMAAWGFRKGRSSIMAQRLPRSSGGAVAPASSSSEPASTSSPSSGSSESSTNFGGGRSGGGGASGSW